MKGGLLLCIRLPDLDVHFHSQILRIRDTRRVAILVHIRVDCSRSFVALCVCVCVCVCVWVGGCVDKQDGYLKRQLNVYRFVDSMSPSLK